jgi:flavin reductase (DIM6/NTAB) family NADH-FMN oxidoreductase RutF
MVTLDPASLDITASYKLLVGTIIPRPIAFITTLCVNGQVNAAPFSTFNLVTAKPMTIVFTIAIKSDGTKKDTLLNIERTREFVVNSAGVWLVEALNHCSGEFAYGVSELEQVGLTTLPSEVVAPPRIRESAVHMECRVHSLVDVGGGAPGSATVIIGEVVRYHIHKAAYEQGKISASELQPVARLAGLQYGLIGDVFELSRPKVGVE